VSSRRSLARAGTARRRRAASAASSSSSRVMSTPRLASAVRTASRLSLRRAGSITCALAFTSYNSTRRAEAFSEDRAQPGLPAEAFSEDRAQAGSCDTISAMAGTIRKAVFPAAGLGTRFLPATKAQPKEMLVLVDKPVIQYGVEEAVASGLQNIVIVTGRGKNAIEDHFDVAVELESFLEQRGKKEQLEEIRKITKLINVCYVRQGEPLGLGPAVLGAK